MKVGSFRTYLADPPPGLAKKTHFSHFFRNLSLSEDVKDVRRTREDRALSQWTVGRLSGQLSIAGL